MKNTLCNILLQLIICIMGANSMYAVNSYNFTQIGLQQGMPSYVNYVYEESNGIVWLDTSNGVIRYDGKELKYYNIPIVGSAFSYKRIQQIIEDKNRQLWFLTVSGLVRYSKENDDFTPCYSSDGQLIVAGAVCEMEDGLLFGAADKLYKYSYASEQIDKFAELHYNDDFFIHRMKFWNSHTLICSNRKKDIVLFDIDKREVLPTFSLKTNYFADLCIDDEGCLWITDYNNGLKRFSQEGKLVAHYTTQNSSLSSDLVLLLVR